MKTTWKDVLIKMDRTDELPEACRWREVRADCLSLMRPAPVAIQDHPPYVGHQIVSVAQPLSHLTDVLTIIRKAQPATRKELAGEGIPYRSLKRMVRAGLVVEHRSDDPGDPWTYEVDSEAK